MRSRSLAGRAASALAALLLCAPLAAAAAQPLGLEEALSIARERSRQLPAHEAAAFAATQLAVAAAQLPDPVFRLGVQNLPIDGPDRFSTTRDFMTMRSVGVMQEFTGAQKRQARAARHAQEAELARAERQAALADLQREAAAAWLGRHYLEAAERLLAAQRDEARLQVEAANALYRANRGSQADVFIARSSLEQLHDRIAEIGRQRAVTGTQLARWIGPAADRPLDRLPAMDTAPLRAGELEARLGEVPELAVMSEQVRLAEAEVALAASATRPDWSAEIMYSQRGPAYSNMISFGVSVPLQLDRDDRQHREVAAKLAIADGVRSRRDEVARARAADIRAMLQQWHGDRERLARYDMALLPLAQERTRATLTAYRVAKGPLAEVLAARQAELETRLQRLALETQIARVWAQLAYLIPSAPGAADARPLE